MNKCKLCRWWNTEGRENKDKMKKCSRLNDNMEVFMDTNDYINQYLGQIGTETSPEFGCVLWESK